MSRFYVIVIVIIAVIIVIAGVLISRSSDQSLSERNAQIEEESRAIDRGGPTPSLVVTSRPSPAASSPGTTMTLSPSITPQTQSPRASTKKAVVIYDGLQFQPPTISITAGTRVVFENQSSEEFWPASNDHPTHQRLSGFDAGKAIAADASYEFQFDKPGDWGYHNHLQPTQTASITVQ